MEGANDDETKLGSLGERLVELCRWWTAFDPSPAQRSALVRAVLHTVFPL